MTQHELLASLRLRLPDAKNIPDSLLHSLLKDAAALICALTWRSQVPAELENAQLRLAVIFFNRMGMEGENQHVEGDVRRSADDLPEALRREIFSYRLART
ncbi:MAG: phage head-tail connector protein [Clostridia bacterium]|nr:phage head-tail connector protein [Clostridia bacterium]